MTALQQAEYVIGWLFLRTEALRKESDRGEAVGWAVVTGLVVAIAVAVGAILLTKGTGAADNVKIQ